MSKLQQVLLKISDERLFDYVCEQLSCFLGLEAKTILRSKFLENKQRSVRAALKDLSVRWVEFPEWAADLAPEGKMLVLESQESNWRQIDWIEQIFLLLNGILERRHEEEQGPIHSYSIRMKGVDSRLWEYAWVNRMALFIRRNVARENHRNEIELFGDLPQQQLVMTHDLDAVQKTTSIALKQSAFNLFKGLKALSRADTRVFGESVHAASRFLLSRDSYNGLNQMIEAERLCIPKPIIHIFSRSSADRRGVKSWLFDPAYRLQDLQYLGILDSLQKSGWRLGLHPSFDSWNSVQDILSQKQDLEQILDCKVAYCRQHWLRFSWTDTWRAQEAAGLQEDSSLGFNDRMGFRNSAAIRFQPWDFERAGPLSLYSSPLAVMDSHIHDYSIGQASTAIHRMKNILTEARKTAAHANFLWHPHTLGGDYGWANSYHEVLGDLSD